ncbi:MAG: 50S ribosomal protein L33 [Polyangiales bacterium]
MGERVPIVLSCAECSARNYKTTRTRQPGSKAIELKKFCPACKRHTVHRESK